MSKGSRGSKDGKHGKDGKDKNTLMNIGQAASQSGLSPKTIRYYETVGLVVPQRQADNRYRNYSAADVRHLGFLHRTRQAGFSLSQSRELLDLYRDPSQMTGSKRQLLMKRVEWLETQQQRLAEMRDLLLDMIPPSDTDEGSEHDTTRRPVQTPTHGMSFTLVDAKP